MKTYGLIFLVVAAIGISFYLAFLYIKKASGYGSRRIDANFLERAMSHGGAARMLGILTIVVGILPGFLAVYIPIHEALHHEGIINIEQGGVGISGLIVWFGLVQLCAGKNSHKYLLSRRGQQSTRLQSIIGWIGVLIAVVLAVAFPFVFRFFGYREL